MPDSIRSFFSSSARGSTRSSTSNRPPVINGPVHIQNATFITPTPDTSPTGSSVRSSSTHRGPLSQRNLALATTGAALPGPPPPNIFNNPNGSVRSATVHPNDSTSVASQQRGTAPPAAAAQTQAAIFDAAFNGASAALAASATGRAGSARGSARGSQRSSSSRRPEGSVSTSAPSPLAGEAGALVRREGSERSSRSEAGSERQRREERRARRRERAGKVVSTTRVYEEVDVLPVVPVVPVFRGFRACPHCHFMRRGPCGCFHHH